MVSARKLLMHCFFSGRNINSGPQKASRSFNSLKRCASRWLVRWCECRAALFDPQLDAEGCAAIGEPRDHQKNKRAWRTGWGARAFVALGPCRAAGEALRSLTA